MMKKIDWSFDTLNQKETNYFTHDIHKYPAKFIPQLASNLIQNYSKKFDIVLDPMGGCCNLVPEMSPYYYIFSI